MEGWTVVTGGAGFIGGHLTERLVARGEKVRVIERAAADVSRLPKSVEVARADIRDKKGVAEALKGCRFVYHLAANPNLWARDRREFDEVNHQGTVNVLEAALAEGAERVLHVSTESILTTSGRRSLIDENVEVDLNDAVGPYCRSKLLAERAAFQKAGEGKPVVVANPTMPVGPGDFGLSPPTRLILDFCLGKLPARMDCTLNLIDVRDVADGLIRVLEVGRPGKRHLLGAENLTLLELLTTLSNLTGVPVPRIRVPYAFGLAVAGMSEIWADRVSGKMPKATLTGVRLARRLMHFDPSRTLDEIGLRPRPIRRSLADAVAWLVGTGRLPTVSAPCNDSARAEKSS